MNARINARLGLEIGAVCISLAGLAISSWFSYKTIQITLNQNTLSLRPALDFEYKFGTGPADGDDGYLRLVNQGAGIARITSVEWFLDKKPILADSTTQLDKSTKIDDAIINVIEKNKGIRFSIIKSSQIIGPQKSINILNILRIKDATQKAQCEIDKERKTLARRIEIVIGYKSIYDEAQPPARFSYTASAGCGADVR